MKKMICTALCVLFVTGVGMANQNPQEDSKKLRAAAAAFESDTAGLEAATVYENFKQGDDTYRVYRTSPYPERRAAVKMAKELCAKGKVTYTQYADFAKEMGFKPKPAKKFKQSELK